MTLRVRPWCGKVSGMIDREEFETYLKGLPPEHNFCLSGYQIDICARRDMWCPLASFLREVKGKKNALVSRSQITGVDVYPSPLLENWQHVFVSQFDNKSWSSRSSTRPPTAALALEVLGGIQRA